MRVEIGYDAGYGCLVWGYDHHIININHKVFASTTFVETWFVLAHLPVRLGQAIGHMGVLESVKGLLKEKDLVPFVRDASPFRYFSVDTF